MNTRDFNIFTTVAETKNLTKASKLLYMTPQGVSKVIKNLEGECDCEFFLRSGMEWNFLNAESIFMNMQKMLKKNIMI